MGEYAIFIDNQFCGICCPATEDTGIWPNSIYHIPDRDGEEHMYVSSSETPYTSAYTIEELNLSPELLKCLCVEMKFEKLSKIQAISLPMILTAPHLDLIAEAHNGSEITTCFAIGMLSRVNLKVQAPQALCICPTRELAIQNLEELKKMGKHTGITSECTVLMDSSNYIPICKPPPIIAQVVIGTPGTIKKWIAYKKLVVSYVKLLVFDEADHMLAEDGFRDDSLRVIWDIQRISSHCQVNLVINYDLLVKYTNRTERGRHTPLESMSRSHPYTEDGKATTKGIHVAGISVGSPKYKDWILMTADMLEISCGLIAGLILFVKLKVHDTSQQHIFFNCFRVAETVLLRLFLKVSSSDTPSLQHIHLKN
ncbi:hypothetical protein CCACVL1_12101 [Corchorus capsularis]|uniref:Helicase ATP-binding domain-containing protein n=1 Tax=Corchorus capsularis TaxID=210143 RepID=A0A1R3IHF1_COCAP|nr:hypothetical protein CCACVL1_12101 [Corchorus capsularis]